MVSESPGALVSRYSVGGLGPIYLVFSIAVLVAALLFASQIYFNDSSEGDVALAVLSGILAFLGAFMMLRWRKYRNASVRIYEDGFVCFMNGRKRSYGWDEVKSVIEVDSRIQRHAMIRRLDLRIKLKNGAKCHMSRQVFPDMDKMADDLQSHMAKYYVPKVIKEITSGKKANFGAFKLDSDGVSRWYKHLPWQEIAGVSRYRAIIFINKINKSSRWASAYIFRVPNYYILMGVINEMASRREPGKGIRD